MIIITIITTTASADQAVNNNIYKIIIRKIITKNEK
jgi:hypothetical protein